MNFTLAKEIYGVPWSIDAVSFQSLSSILKNIQNGVKLDASETKLNSISLLQITSKTKLINEVWDLNSSDSFEGIGIINLNGPITKNGGQSTYGTKQISSQMLQMSKDSRMKGFIIKTDSGGGATGAVQLMIDAINEVKKTMPVYALVEKGGMAGSAAYGIISAATEIYSEDEMNIVGSVGTMIQFSGKPHGNVDSNGEKTIVLYASKSTEKNKGFEDAINNDNYEVIINDMLNPINENFITNVLSNRPQLEGSKFDNGHTVFSKDAVGTFIDGIASFDEVVSMIVSGEKSIKNSNSNSNSKSSKMTKEEFKQAHPFAHAEIVSEGITQGVAKEKERVGSWMAYESVDPKAVKAGIESGLDIGQAQSHSFLVRIASNGRIADAVADSAEAISTAETATEGVPAMTAKAAEIAEAFNFDINPKTK